MSGNGTEAARANFKRFPRSGSTNRSIGEYCCSLIQCTQGPCKVFLSKTTNSLIILFYQIKPFETAVQLLYLFVFRLPKVKLLEFFGRPSWVDLKLVPTLPTLFVKTWIHSYISTYTYWLLWIVQLSILQKFILSGFVVIHWESPVSKRMTTVSSTNWGFLCFNLN